MKIGVIVACDEELNSILKIFESNNLKVQTKSIDNFLYYIFKYKNKKIVVCKTGIGKTFASFKTQKFIDDFSVDFIINCGACGGLDNKFKINDILIIDKVIDWDINPEFIAEDYRVIKTDKKLSNFALKQNNKVKCCSLATGDNFVCDKKTKEKILHELDCHCCDMEGMAIAKVCKYNDKKLLLVKAVSDGRESMDEFEYNFANTYYCLANFVFTIIKNIEMQDIK